MNNHIKGCGRDEGQRTLYVVKDNVPPVPSGANYWHVRCWYRPPSRIQNGILLCDACIAKLGLPLNGFYIPAMIKVRFEGSPLA